MRDHLIFVNGKSENLSIDTNEPIIINWKKLEEDQKSYRIRVFDGHTVVFDSKIIESPQPFSQITLPHSSNRKEYIIELEIISNSNKVISYQKVVYSNNENLIKASWITRLDNPIEKEWNYFQDRPNMIFEKDFYYDGIKRKVFLLELIIYMVSSRDNYYLLRCLQSSEHTRFFLKQIFN